jgi:hypothetical protein
VSNPELVGFPSIAFKVGSWYWKENAIIINSNQTPIKGLNFTLSSRSIPTHVF